MPITITMPALSPTMTEGNLVRWLVKEGDKVSAGDLLAEIETDKATMEMECIDDGTVGKILIAEGTEEIAVNTPLAVLLAEGEDASVLEGMAVEAPPPPPAATAPEPVAASAPAAPTPSVAPAPAPQATGTARVAASPLARRLAEQAGIDLTALAGSGPRGRIVKRDVEQAISSGGAGGAPAAPATPETTMPVPVAGAPGAFTDVRIDLMRKTVALRLTESKQNVPHFYINVDCRIDRLLAMRKELNAKSPEGEDAFKVSVNDFVIRAMALALKKVPEANAAWVETAIRRFESADIAVAVAVEGGLITPVIRGADHKGLAEISNEMQHLAARAREKKLLPEDYEGGTFSVSNLGMYGVRDFSAIINPPQAGILAVGAGEQRPVVDDGALGIATVMTCTLSCDHRVIDGALGAELLAAFKGFIEDPLTMML